MKLVPSEEQEFLGRTAHDFGARKSPAERSRALRDGTPWTPALWTEMARLGWTGVHLDEAHGGSALGFTELCTVVEELGRTLTPEPLISTVAVSASGLALLGNGKQKQRHLPRIAAGAERFAFAHDERGARYRDFYCALKATKDGDGYHLHGMKRPVLDARHADWLIVSARTSGDTLDRNGLTLFIVPADAPGVRIDKLERLDGRDAAVVTFDGVAVTADSVLGGVDGGAEGVSAMLDRGRVALSAEMVGAADAAFQMTLGYLRERVQFDQPIGAFQALQHRAAYLLADIELARSAVIAAAQAFDEERADAAEFASLAKATCSEMFIKVTHEAVQMHGGIGVTDEHNIGLYLKRARVAQCTWGDASYHRRRWATLRGY